MRQLFSRRAALLGAVQAAGFGVLGARLYQLQVIEGQRYAPLAERNRLSVHHIAPMRGRIFDRAGRVLADNENNFRLILTPSLAPDVAAVLSRVERVITISREDRDRAMALARRQAPGLPIIVRDKLTFAEVARLSAMAPYLPGVETDLIGQRRYHHGHETGQIVGYVGAVDRFALDDDPILRVPGIRIGKLGVEDGMDEHLRGQSGWLQREVNARGQIKRDLRRAEPVQGWDVRLSIDVELQRQILAALAGMRRGAVVALDVSSGEIVAIASVPAADVSVVGEGITSDDWRSLVRAAGDPLFNRALRGQYPPGSTYKMVTALAALEAGVIDPAEEVTCRGAYKLGRRSFRCWNRGGHGPMDLHRALKHSCDVYFYEIANRAGIERLAAMARQLGFGQTFPGLGVALQAKGVVPDPSWKTGRLGKPWYGGETLHVGIGQGYVTATPLQLAVMMARLATNRKVTPTLLAPGDKVRARSQGAQLLAIDPVHLNAVQRALVAAVHERGGTAGRAQLDDRLTLVAGKTGSAQVTSLTSRVSQESLPWEKRDHALFVSYVPADAPRYAVSVVVEHGMSGGKAAAPIAREVMKVLLDFTGEGSAPSLDTRSLDMGATNGTARPG